MAQADIGATSVQEAGADSGISWWVPSAAPPRRPTTANAGPILAAWRAAERELGEIAGDSPDWPRVNAELVALRADYHRLFEERLRRVEAW